MIRYSRQPTSRRTIVPCNNQRTLVCGCSELLAVRNLPAHLLPKERKLIVQCSSQFSWICGYIFHTASNLQIQRCIREDEAYDILKSCHNDACDGNFADHRIGHKILQMGYYWPTIFKNTKKYIQVCDRFHKIGRPY